jgi:hypothetical protein
MTVHQTVASAAIRIETEGFKVADGIEAGLPKVRKAFEASVRLIEFYSMKAIRLTTRALARPQVNASVRLHEILHSRSASAARSAA